MASKYFKVSGYWKDDKSEFSDCIIKEFDDSEGNEFDDSIFYYGLNENSLKASCDEDALDFVITEYVEIDLDKW